MLPSSDHFHTLPLLTACCQQHGTCHDPVRGCASVFAYEGNRAVVLSPDGQPSRKALAHCIALALTYHQRKNLSRSR